MLGFDALNETALNELPGAGGSTIFCDSASPLIVGGGVGGDNPMLPGWINLLLRDSPKPVEFFVPVLRDSSSNVEITNDVRSNTIAPTEIGVAVSFGPVIVAEILGTDLVLSIDPFGFKGRLLADSQSNVDTGGSIYVDDSHDMPLEHTVDVKPLTYSPLEILSAAPSFAWMIPFEDFALVRVDSATAPIEITNDVHADSAAWLIDLAVQVINLFGVLTEWRATLQQDGQSGAEHLTAEGRDSAQPVEETMEVRAHSSVPMEIIGSGIGESAAGPFEHIGTEQRDAPLAAEHTVDVPVQTAAPVEITMDVKALASVPLEKTFDVKPMFAVPIQFTTDLRFDTATFPIGATGLLLVDSLAAVERLLGVSAAASAVAERLGGLAADMPVNGDQKATVERDSQSPSDTTGVVAPSQSFAPVEVGGGVSTTEPSPAEWRGTMAVDGAFPTEFRTWLAQSTPALAEALAAIRQDQTVPMEAAGTVYGLTGLGASYSATLAVDRSVPAEVLAAVAAAAAVAVERVGQLMHADATGPAEWTGALLVDLPVPAERAAKLLLDATAARIEITMDVHRDEGEPIAFYGYALVPQVTLQGSKVAVQLEGSKVAVDLEGSKVQILLVGQIK
jgi:hypothetical protein